jgi:mRNA interferase RelE/StbE
MKLRLTERARRDFDALPISLQRRAQRQLDFLCGSLRYPSLHAKKYDEARDIWQARITRDWRFCFHPENDEYVILAITKHP